MKPPRRIIITPGISQPKKRHPTPTTMGGTANLYASLIMTVWMESRDAAKKRPIACWQDACCGENSPFECRCIVRQKRSAYRALAGELLMPGEDELHPIFEAELQLFQHGLFDQIFGTEIRRFNNLF